MRRKLRIEGLEDRCLAASLTLGGLTSFHPSYTSALVRAHTGTVYVGEMAGVTEMNGSAQTGGSTWGIIGVLVALYL